MDQGEDLSLFKGLWRRTRPRKKEKKEEKKRIEEKREEEGERGRVEPSRRQRTLPSTMSSPSPPSSSPPTLLPIDPRRQIQSPSRDRHCPLAHGHRKPRWSVGLPRRPVHAPFLVLVHRPISRRSNSSFRHLRPVTAVDGSDRRCRSRLLHHLSPSDPPPPRAPPDRRCLQICHHSRRSPTLSSPSTATSPPPLVARSTPATNVVAVLAVDRRVSTTSSPPDLPPSMPSTPPGAATAVTVVPPIHVVDAPPSCLPNNDATRDHHLATRSNHRHRATTRSDTPRSSPTLAM